MTSSAIPKAMMSRPIIVRAKIREIVKDPAVCRASVPRLHPWLQTRRHRPRLLYEAFNRSNVRLVDISAAPIEAITPAGLRTSRSRL